MNVIQNHTSSTTKIRQRKPGWLKLQLASSKTYKNVRHTIESYKLHTVCEEAKCPNKNECWNAGTATFMILGNVCTRNCRFCGVQKGNPSSGSDLEEPQRVANAVKQMNLKHVVITSVTRDDLSDGGASIFAHTIKLIHQLIPYCKVEVLVPDFKGNEDALDIILNAKPDILNHNLETVPRLYPLVRSKSNYLTSLALLEKAKNDGFITKSGLMLGVGEQTEEIIEVMKDLRSVECDILTLGQYLQPNNDNIPVARYVHPTEFKHLKETGLKIGFHHIEAGPFVRSSYHAINHI